MELKRSENALPWKTIGMKISDYVREMNDAFERKLFISALSLSMIIPDICATALDEKSFTNRDKYRSWLDRYLIPITATDSCFSISSSDIYQIRNSVLHNGSLATNPGKQTRYHNIRFHVFSLSDSLIISDGYFGVGDDPESEEGKEFHLTINLAKYVKCMTDAVAEFLEQHPECDKPIDKDRLGYSGIVDFSNSN